VGVDSSLRGPHVAVCNASVSAVLQDWNAEEFSGGCYTGYMGPGTMTAFGKHLAEREGALFFAGTETAEKWAGYMDGAVRAGERAAREVLSALDHPSLPPFDPPVSLDVPPIPNEVLWWERLLPNGSTAVVIGGASVVAVGMALWRRIRK